MRTLTRTRLWMALPAAALAVSAGLLAGGSPANAAAGSWRLNPGEALTSGQQLVSQAGGYTAIMQSDGNFVEYGPGHVVVWATGTNGHSGSDLEMQTDGNLVVYAPGHVAIWSTRTSGQPGTDLELGTRGNSSLALFAPGNREIWSR